MMQSPLQLETLILSTRSNLLQSGATDQRVIAQMLGLPEYFGRASTGQFSGMAS
jgi:hypothetical protein